MCGHGRFCSVSLVVNWWCSRDLSKKWNTQTHMCAQHWHTGTHKRTSSSLSTWSLYVCWDMPSTLLRAVYNSALAFRSCLHRTWSSARGKSLQISQVFWMHTQTLECMWSSREYVAAFQRLYSPNPLIPQPFFLRFLVSLLFTPTVNPCPRWQWLQHLFSNVFNKALTASFSHLFR